MLSKRNNIDIVFAPNDMMAYGAWEVARELEVEKNIKFIGVVGLPGPNVGLDLVKKGVFNYHNSISYWRWWSSKTSFKFSNKSKNS